MRVLNVLLVVSAAAIAITGCNQQPGVKSDVSIIQTNVCEAGDSRRDVVASACKPGQKECSCRNHGWAMTSFQLFLQQ